MMMDNAPFYDGPLSRACILVVDDEHLTVRAIQRVLKTCGALVVCCSSVKEARTVIEDSAIPFDAAVIDYQLVGCEVGTEILELLRSGSYPCCSMMITGSQDPENGRRAFQAGADDYMLKPFDVHQFVDALEVLVERTEDRRAKIATTPYDPNRPSVPPFRQSEPVGHLLDAGADALRSARARQSVLLEQTHRISTMGGLSKREREILREILQGQKNVDISCELGITARTVKYHVRNILKKCGAESRAGLTALLWKPDPLLPPAPEPVDEATAETEGPDDVDSERDETGD